MDLKPDELKEVLRLLEWHVSGVRVLAFGSRVKGTARRNSDLDLVVFADHASLGALREAFEESCLPFQVDVHAWDDLPAEFHAQILAHSEELKPFSPQS